jgi:hypothetical protein
VSTSDPMGILASLFKPNRRAFSTSGGIGSFHQLILHRICCLVNFLYFVPVTRALQKCRQRHEGCNQLRKRGYVFHTVTALAGCQIGFAGE